MNTQQELHDKSNLEYKGITEDEIAKDLGLSPQGPITNPLDYGRITPGGDFGGYKRDQDLSYLEAKMFPNELDYQRADAQSGSELLGKAIGQGAVEASLGALEGIAYGLDPTFWADAIKGEGDFDNAIAKAIRETKEGIQDEWFPIYQSQTAQNGTLGQKMSDATWWAGQGKTMGTTLSLMFPAMGVGAIVGKAAKLAKIGSKAVQMGISGMAAGAFSRNAESAMEANQKFQEAYEYWKQNPELQESLLNKYTPQAEAINSQIDNLKNQMPAPGIENYQMLNAQWQNKMNNLIGQKNMAKSSFEKDLEVQARERAGREAAGTYKANMALMPVDMIQYALLLKPLAGIKKATDLASKGTLGQVVENLVVQPASESFEEGFQFVSGEEASSSVRNDTKMYGEGFADRMSEYVKDPTFHESVFLGGAMGLVFSGAGPAARKTYSKSAQLLNALGNERIAKNPDKVKKVLDENKSEVLGRALINENLDKSISIFTSELEKVKNNNEISGEEKESQIANYEKSIEDLNFIKAEDQKLQAIDEYRDNPKARHSYVMAKFDDISTNKAINENKEAYDEELSKVGNEILFPKSEIKKSYEGTESEIDEIKKEILNNDIEINSYENSINQLNNTEYKQVPNKKAIISSLENDIKARIETRETLVNSLKERTKFKESDLAVNNKEDLKRSHSKVLENEIRKQFITGPTLESFNNPKTAPKQEAEINKVLSKEQLKEVNEGVKLNIEGSETLEQLEQLKLDISSIEGISKENISELDRRISEEQKDVDFDSAKTRQELGKRLQEAQTIEQLDEIVESAKMLPSSEEATVNAVIQGANAKKVKLTSSIEDKVNEPKIEITEEIPTQEASDLVIIETSDFKTNDVVGIVEQPLEETTEEEAYPESTQVDIKDENLSFATTTVKKLNKETNEDARDSSGRQKYDDRNKLELGVVDNYNVGDKVVLKLDKVYYDQLIKKGTKITPNNLPISIQTVKDIEAGRSPLTWMRSKKPTKSDLKLKQFLLDNLFKNGKPDFKSGFTTTISKNHKDFTNRTLVAKSFNEQFKKEDGTYPNNILIQAANKDGKIIGQILDKEGNIETISADNTNKPGFSHVVFQRSDGGYQASQIGQSPISSEKHSKIRDKFVNNAYSIITEFAKGNTEFTPDAKSVRDNVGVYFNINPVRDTDEIKLAKEDDKYNNHFGFGYDSGVNGYVLQLPGQKTKKGNYPFQQYVLTTESNGSLKVAKYVGGKSYQYISEDELKQDFFDKLGNMFPNLKNINKGNDFVRLRNTKDGLAWTEPAHYFDFLSAYGIAKTKVYGEEINGNMVFTNSPFLEINNNIESISKYTPGESAKIETEQKNLSNESDDTNIELPPLEDFEDDGTIGVDLDADFDSGIIDNLNANDYNNSSLSAFDADYDIVSSLLTLSLLDLDKTKAETGKNNKEESLNKVKEMLVQSQKKFKAASQRELTKEEAKKYRVRLKSSDNLKIAEALESTIDKFEKQVDDNGIIILHGYRELVSKKIDETKFNIIVVTEDDIDEGDVAGEAYLSGKNYKEDPEKSMSGKVRRLFYDIPVYSRTGKPKANAIGMYVYQDPTSVFNQVADVVTDVRIEDMIDELRSVAETDGVIYNHTIKNVLNKIDKLEQSAPEIVNNFLSAMRKQKANSVMIKYEIPKGSSAPKVKIIQTNRNGIDDLILNNWSEGFNENILENDLIKKEVKLKLDKLTVDNLQLNLKYIFKQLAIDLDERAYEQIKKEFYKKNKYFGQRFGSSSQASDLAMFFKSELKGVVDDLSNGENPYDNQKGRLKNFASYQAKFEEEATSRMFRNSKNDNIYSIVNPHHLSNVYSDFKFDKTKVEELLNDPFKSSSSWLKTLEEYHDLMNNDNKTQSQTDKLGQLTMEVGALGLMYFDAAKNDTTGAFAREYQDQSPAEKEITKLNTFINNGGLTGYVFNPTPSDKTTFSLSSFKKIDASAFVMKDDSLSARGDKALESKALLNQLSSLLIASEIKRINHNAVLFDNAVKNNNDFGNLIEGFHYIKTKNGKYVPGTGSYFMLLPGLNDLALDTNSRNKTNGEILTVEKFTKSAVEHMKESISELVNKKKLLWEQVGITSNGKLEKADSSTKDMSTDGLAISYVINSMVSLTNQYMITSSDPAQFGKVKGFDGNWGNWSNLLDQTHSNMFKRLAKDIAPGLEGRFDKKEYDIMMIKDPVIDGQIGEYFEDLKSAYSNIELADAQEWTSLQEHLDVMKAYGKINQDQYNELLKKGRDKTLNTSDLATILQPAKPVQVLNKFEEDLGQSVAYYIKTSSFPLIPQLVEQFDELNSLRNLMETNGIARVMPKSAIKTGFRKAFDLANLNSTTPFNRDANVITLNRDGFRIQQEVPYSSEKKAILRGSQLSKLMFANLVGKDGKAYEFDLNGEVKTGKELKDIADRIQVQLYKNRFAKLLDNFGIEKTADGYSIKDFNTIRDLLVSEADSRGYGDNDILALKTIEFNGNSMFDLPLYFHPMVHKIEQLLTSVAKNKILKNKMSGKSYVQGSSYGFKAKDENFFKKFGDFNGITFTKEYDSQKGLRYIKNEDGSIEAQIFIAMPFKKGKKPLNIETYKNEDGTLDLNRIPDEMLKMIGYRIPTQKFSSMIKLKVVGILPEYSGDLIIIPPEMSAQMGSDFDVDKLFLHWFNYKTDDAGNVFKDIPPKTDKSISKLISGIGNFDEMEFEEDSHIENLLLEIYHSILSHKDIAKETVTPLDNNVIADVITEMDKLKSKSSKRSAMDMSVINDVLHSDMVEIQAAGQVGIGIESVASTMHILSQYAGLYINNHAVKFSNTTDDVNEFNDNNSIKTNSETEQSNPTSNTTDNTNSYNSVLLSEEGAFRLDKIYGFNGMLISDVIANLQTEAVDNANNRRLYPMNLNKVTFDVANLIARAGFDERFIGYYLNQPIVLKYVEQVSNMNRYDDSNFTKDKLKNIQLEMLKELGVNIDSIEKLSELSTSNIALTELKQGIIDDNVKNDTQKRALVNFIVYNNITNELRDWQNSANIDTKFLGASIPGVVEKSKFFNNTENMIYIGNAMNLHKKNDVFTAQGYAYEIGVREYLNVIKKILPVDSKLLNQLQNKVKALYGKPLREDDLQKIDIAVRSASYNEAIKQVFNIEDIDKYRTDLVLSKNTLGNKLLKFKKANPNNKFTNSLNIFKPSEEGDPIEIRHISSKNERSDIALGKELAWLKMLNSDKNSPEYKLGLDLLIYSTTFGTERSAHDFGRFIPDDFLIKSGIKDVLKTINFNNIEDSKISNDISDNLLIQFIRHNDNYVKGISKDDVVSGSLKGDLLEIKPESLLRDANGNFPFMLKKYDADNSSYDLYIKKKKIGENTFTKIGHLGKNQLTEYNTSKKYHDSIFNKNYKEIYFSDNDMSDNIITRNTKDIREDVLNDYDFSNDSVNLSEVLSKVVEIGQSDTNKALAKHYLNNISKLNGVKLERFSKDNPEHQDESGRIPGKGSYISDKNIITIVKSGISGKEVPNKKTDFEHSLLHEVGHAFTSLVMSNPSKQTDEQKAIIAEIDKIRLEFKKSVPTDSRLLNYFFDNNREFTTAVLSNPEMQEFLSKQEYKQNKTTLQRLLDLVKNLLNFGIKENTALYSAMDNVLTLIDTVSSEQMNTIRRMKLPAIDPNIHKEAAEIKNKCKS